MTRIEGPHPGEELNTSGEVSPPRVAATIILLRDSDEGPEALLVKRNPEQKFFGGAWVFPGGSVHDEDGSEEATAIRELEEEAGVDLAADHELVRFSRWITPKEIQIRFDTHFFVAEAPADAEPTVDGDECVDWTWVRPQAALDKARSEEMLLPFPTMKHVEQLAEYRSVSETLESARARKVLPVEPRVLVDGGVAHVLLPDEEGYDDA